eukprot:CAMPEP_0172941054 /NCGR_PEP_ID=MMETSP1075-20121228/224346_1 /TAXON_ID=2916 /ORGANISM="Ceratium fusus, Strain PA161109" /LENGTH=188 /DNA_ID=CAMNT_0013802465 /DNA_START=1858 /DNA_END=2423 /DNA_ORIENTATION=+
MCSLKLSPYESSGLPHSQLELPGSGVLLLESETAVACRTAGDRKAVVQSGDNLAGEGEHDLLLGGGAAAKLPGALGLLELPGPHHQAAPSLKSQWPLVGRDAATTEALQDAVVKDAFQGAAATGLSSARVGELRAILASGSLAVLSVRTGGIFFLTPKPSQDTNTTMAANTLAWNAASALLLLLLLLL